MWKPNPQTRELGDLEIQKVQVQQYNKILLLIDGINDQILKNLDRHEIRTGRGRRPGEDWRNNVIEVTRALKEAFGLHKFMPVSTEVPVGQRVQITNVPDDDIIDHIKKRIREAEGIEGMQNLICSFMRTIGLDMERFTNNCS